MNEPIVYPDCANGLGAMEIYGKYVFVGILHEVCMCVSERQIERFRL